MNSGTIAAELYQSDPLTPARFSPQSGNVRGLPKKKGDTAIRTIDAQKSRARMISVSSGLSMSCLPSERARSIARPFKSDRIRASRYPARPDRPWPRPSLARYRQTWPQGSQTALEPLRRVDHRHHNCLLRPIQRRFRTQSPARTHHQRSLDVIPGRTVHRKPNRLFERQILIQTVIDAKGGWHRCSCNLRIFGRQHRKRFQVDRLRSTEPVQPEMSQPAQLHLLSLLPARR